MTRLRIVDRVVTDFEDLQPGDMWRNMSLDEPDRECWFVLLAWARRADGLWPVLWRTTAKVANRQPPSYWDIQGTPPNITVRPSINVVGYWHGFITNGELVPVLGGTP